MSALFDFEVPYAERPEWADVTPIEQYEGVNPVAPIYYSPECMLPFSKPQSLKNG